MKTEEEIRKRIKELKKNKEKVTSSFDNSMTSFDIKREVLEWVLVEEVDDHGN